MKSFLLGVFWITLVSGITYSQPFMIEKIDKGMICVPEGKIESSNKTSKELSFDVKCAYSRENYYNNNFEENYHFITIITDNFLGLKKFINDTGSEKIVLLFKCNRGSLITHFSARSGNYQGTEIKVRRKEIVVTDYNSYIEKYLDTYNKYGCIPE